MYYKLKFIASDETDFALLKRNGFGGVIFAQKHLTKENLEKAKQNKLKRFVHIGNLSKIGCEYLKDGRVKEGAIYAVTADSAEGIINSLKELISYADGFVIPFPCIAGLLWDESFVKEYEKFCGKCLYDDLPILFDKDIAEADIREWYYKRSADKIFEDFISPLSRCIKSYGKTACFELGNMEKGHYAVRKLIVPSKFGRAKIPTICEKDGEQYYISPEHNKRSETLLVTSVRGIMRMYAWDTAFSKEESDFSLAVCEEEYYRTSLEKCGITAYVIDDFEFSRMRTDSLIRFSNIIILKSCIVDGKKIEKLHNMGVKVNDTKLLEMIDRVN